MLPLVLLLAIAAGDVRVDIVERSTLGLSAPASVRLRERLKVALERDELTSRLAASRCADRACLMALAKSAGTCVVGVTVVKGRKGLTIDLEAVDATSVVLQHTFLLSTDRLEDSPEAQVFAHQLNTRLLKDTPVVEPERAAAPTLLEPVVEAQPAWLEPAPAPVFPRVLGGVSAGVGAVAIGLVIAGAVVKGQLATSLNETPVVTTLTRAQAQQQADAANALLGTGVVALIIAAAGGTTALLLGVSAPSSVELAAEMR